MQDTRKTLPLTVRKEFVEALYAGRKSHTTSVGGLGQINQIPDAYALKEMTTNSAGDLVPVFTRWDNDLVSGGTWFGNIGTELWVREWHVFLSLATGESLIRYYNGDTREITENKELNYIRNKTDIPRPGMFSPRWGSRADVTITALSIGRLLALTDDEIALEGLASDKPGSYMNYSTRAEPYTYGLSALDSYLTLWDNSNKKIKSARNPWVWKAQFELHKGDK